MNRKTLVASLKQIETLVVDCLKAVEDNHAASPKASKEAPASKQGRKHSSGLTLPDCIVEVRDAGFFKEPRTAREVHEKLRSTYPCELNRVVMALLRLNERKRLRRASKLVDKKKQVAYVW